MSESEDWTTEPSFIVSALSLIVALLSFSVAARSCSLMQEFREDDLKRAKANLIVRGENTTPEIPTPEPVLVFNDGLEQAAITGVSFVIDKKIPTPGRRTMYAGPIPHKAVEFQFFQIQDNQLAKKFDPPISVPGKSHMNFQVHVVSSLNETNVGTTLIGRFRIHYDDDKTAEAEGVVVDITPPDLFHRFEPREPVFVEPRPGFPPQ